MVFTDEQIEQFRELHFKRFGVEISKEVAYEQATKLIRMLLVVYQPMSIEEHEQVQKERLEMLPRIIQRIASQENNAGVQ